MDYPTPLVSSSRRDMNPVYSIVVPVYNEEETLPELQRRLALVMDRLDGTVEFVLVDDGSSDQSLRIMRDFAASDDRVRACGLSRNFGHQVAVSAGLDLARGDAVVVLDADLQDPPEVILELAARWREGFDIVHARRSERAGETWFKRTTARQFYRLLNRLTEVAMPEDVGDFRLVDRRALNAVRSMRERSRYLRGMFAWVGFRQTSVFYKRDPRHAGATKYPLAKMLRFAATGVVSFSDKPLRIALNVGFLVSGLAFLTGSMAVAVRLFGGFTIPGWASLAVITTFLGGMQLVMLGVIGEYLSRVYDEVKRRPLYFVSTLDGHELSACLAYSGMLTSEDVAPAGGLSADPRGADRVST